MTRRHWTAFLDQRLVDSDVSEGISDWKMCLKFRLYQGTLEYLVLYQTYCRRARLFTNPAVAKRRDIVCVIEVRFSRLRDKEDSETAYKQNF